MKLRHALTVLAATGLLASLAPTANALPPAPQPTDRGDEADFNMEVGGELTHLGFVRQFRQSGMFQQMDKDRSGGLNQQEFLDVAFNEWDTSGDGMVSVVEFRQHAPLWYNEPVTVDFDDWDVDGSGNINRGEFDSQAMATDLYSDWNLGHGAEILSGEFAPRFFAVIDTEDDGMLSMAEMQMAGLV